LAEFASAGMMDLKIFEVKGSNKGEHKRLKKYWNTFYKKFTAFLYKQKKCNDNYNGQNIK